MKMRIVHKFILVIGAIIVLAIGAAMLLSHCGVLSFSVPEATDKASYYSWQRITVFACAVYLVLYALYVIAFPGKLRYNRHDFIVQKNENGDLLISVKAIENLVQKCVDMHEEINVNHTKIFPDKKNRIIVRMRITLANNVSIPLAVDSLQKQIKKYVLASSGIEVSNVVVSVDTNGSESVSGSPYDVSAAREPEEEKKMLHQRLFEQDEEPVTVTAPEAEEAVQSEQKEAVSVPEAVQEEVSDAVNTQAQAEDNDKEA